MEGRVFAAGFNFLNIATTKLRFFCQILLSQFGSGTQAAHILAKNNLRCPLHLSYHAGRMKVESEL